MWSFSMMDREAACLPSDFGCLFSAQVHITNAAVAAVTTPLTFSLYPFKVWSDVFMIWRWPQATVISPPYAQCARIQTARSVFVRSVFDQTRSMARRSTHFCETNYSRMRLVNRIVACRYLSELSASSCACEHIYCYSTHVSVCFVRPIMCNVFQIHYVLNTCVRFVEQIYITWHISITPVYQHTI